jgi:putative serine protease PepD
MGTAPDWTAIATAVQSSTVTVETAHGLGSGWVARTDEGGAQIVTNFHVVAETWIAGDVTLHVKQHDRTILATITAVSRSEDLAVIHVSVPFPVLRTAARRPQLGDTVLAVGSPLGLGGSLSAGMVSGFRSLDGTDYLQFSAPISPGNSGGPVVDRQGRVVGVTAAKFEGQGVEALSLAIPIETVCRTILICSSS